MKKILLITLSFILAFSAKSQLNQLYPRFYIQNGDTLGVIISIKQAQKIDNDYDILSLFKKSGKYSDSLQSSYILVVDNMGKEIAELKVKNSKFESIDSIQTEMISNLKLQILNYQKSDSLANKELADDNEIIKNYKKENTKLRIQKFISGTLGTGLLITVVTLLLVKH